MARRNIFFPRNHTFCSWLAIRGVPLTAIQKLAGHASIKMTLRYAHLSPRYLADEVKALDRFQQDGKPNEGPTSENACSPGDERSATEQSPGMDEVATTTDVEDGDRRRAAKGGQSRQGQAGDARNRQKIGKLKNRHAVGIAKLLKDWLLR
jgi:hypothetical protein